MDTDSPVHSVSDCDGTSRSVTAALDPVLASAFSKAVGRIEIILSGASVALTLARALPA